MILWGATQSGPALLPGQIHGAIDRGRRHADAVVRGVKHPLRPMSDADLQFQWDLASRIRDKVNEANRAVIGIRRIKTDMAERIKERPRKCARRASARQGAVGGGRGRLPGEEPERTGSAQLPDQDQQPAGVAAARGRVGEGRPTGNVEPIFNDLMAGAEGGNGSSREDDRRSVAAVQQHAAANQKDPDHALIF